MGIDFYTDILRRKLSIRCGVVLVSANVIGYEDFYAKMWRFNGVNGTKSISGSLNEVSRMALNSCLNKVSRGSFESKFFPRSPRSVKTLLTYSDFFRHLIYSNRIKGDRISRVNSYKKRKIITEEDFKEFLDGL